MISTPSELGTGALSPGASWGFADETGRSGGAERSEPSCSLLAARRFGKECVYCFRQVPLLDLRAL